MKTDEALHRLRAHAIAVAVVRPELDLVEATECVADELDRLREREVELRDALDLACRGNVDRAAEIFVERAREQRARLKALVELVGEEEASP